MSKVTKGAKDKKKKEKKVELDDSEEGTVEHVSDDDVSQQSESKAGSSSQVKKGNNDNKGKKDGQAKKETVGADKGGKIKIELKHSGDYKSFDTMSTQVSKNLESLKGSLKGDPASFFPANLMEGLVISMAETSNDR